MDWKECKDRRLVKEVKEDKELVRSLIKLSDKKTETNERINLDETTASTKVSLAYESLREILEALAIKKGFKVYNHECFCSFLKEIIEEERLSQEFDVFRMIRNQTNYYGKDVAVTEAKNIIKGINILRNKLMSKYLK